MSRRAIYYFREIDVFSEPSESPVPSKVTEDDLVALVEQKPKLRPQRTDTSAHDSKLQNKE